MGCNASGACCGELPHTASNAVYISTPMGARMQVHYHNAGLPFTLLLSLHFAERLVSEVAAIAADSHSNVFAFVTPLMRETEFADYDCCLWFLMTCPKVPLASIVLYVSAEEVHEAVKVCEHYPTLAGLIINSTQIDETILDKSIEELRVQDTVECPLLLIHEGLVPDAIRKYYSSSHANLKNLKEVPKNCKSQDVFRSAQKFLESLGSRNNGGLMR